MFLPLSSSVVGSIGAITASFGLHEAINKLGIERRVLTAGSRKLIYDPFRPVNEAEAAIIQNLLNEIHKNFKTHVENSRGGRLVGDRDKLFSGEIWVGKQAVELGLADGLHTVDSFIRYFWDPYYKTIKYVVTQIMARFCFIIIGAKRDQTSTHLHLLYRYH